MADEKKESRVAKKKLRPCGDAYRIKEADSMHLFMPYLLPNRADNEAFLCQKIDLTDALAYLERLNAANPAHRYTIFHLICASLAKTVTLRPKLNRFYAGYRYYQREKISFSFVAKKQFSDESHESMVILSVDPTSHDAPVTSIHEAICEKVYPIKAGHDDEATDIMSTLVKMPRPILKLFTWGINVMEYYGILPKSFCAVDPYHATVFITNLGSIKMQAGYHHLANWGTNSVFLTIGEIKEEPIYQKDGTVVWHKMIELGYTLDERIADGYYYSRTLKLVEQLLTHPELLEQPLCDPVDFE